MSNPHGEKYRGDSNLSTPAAQPAETPAEQGGDGKTKWSLADVGITPMGTTAPSVGEPVRSVYRDDAEYIAAWRTYARTQAAALAEERADRMRQQEQNHLLTCARLSAECRANTAESLVAQRDAEIARLKGERDVFEANAVGQNDTVKLLFAAKNNWMDRAIDAESSLATASQRIGELAEMAERNDKIQRDVGNNDSANAWKYFAGKLRELAAQRRGQEADSELERRITDYLSGGGLFNPEMANHDAVRDLLIDCRAALSTHRTGGKA